MQDAQVKKSLIYRFIKQEGLGAIRMYKGIKRKEGLGDIWMYTGK